MSPRTSRRLLQIAVAIGGLVPVGAGLAGVLLGPGMTGDHGSPDLESHMRYLSGLLLAIGLLFWSTIPKIEARRDLFLALTTIVATGGIARLFGLLHSIPSPAMFGGLAMELLVTPLLCCWQRSLSAESARHILPGARLERPAPPDIPR